MKIKWYHPIFVFTGFVAFLFLFTSSVMGYDSSWVQIRRHFGGYTGTVTWTDYIDGVRADSGGYAPDTFLKDSVWVPDVSSFRRLFRVSFFSGSQLLDDEIYRPPIEYYVSGGVIDTNRSEQGGTGTGSNTIDVYVMDTDSNAVIGAYVEFQNWAISGMINNTYSDENGIARVATNADSVAVRVIAPMYDYSTSWDSMVVVSGNYLLDSIEGSLNAPSAAGPVNYVTAYIDVGSGIIDSSSGAMIPRDRLKFTLSLVGEPSLNDGSWAYVPKDWEKAPNASGRVTFTIPANTVLTPEGSYYELRYQTSDRRTRSSGVYRMFIVDTIPDPINILETTEVR